MHARGRRCPPSAVYSFAAIRAPGSAAIRLADVGALIALHAQKPGAGPAGPLDSAVVAGLIAVRLEGRRRWHGVQLSIGIDSWVCWVPSGRRETPADEREQVMLVLGLILLLLGIFLSVPILYTIGIILLVVGAALWILGAIGRPVGGRKVWF